ncbi:MAG TPA: transglutaminase domain-containing protein, partial [Puia sp.]|nr:transglutaminase domain-containing protein [Puia sp.]
MNISKLLAVSFCLLFLQNYLSAQDKLNIKWGKISSEDFKLPDNALIDSNANAVIIADMGYTNFVGNNNGWFSWVFKRKTRIKILNKRGISAATHEIQLYNNEEDREKTDDITGSTYNLEGSNIVETKLSKKEVFEDRLDKNHVDTKFTLPAVKEGSIIEFSYTIKSPFYYNIPSWSFQNIEFPALWSEYEVTIPTTLIYVYLKQGTDAFHVQTLTQSRANYHVTEHAENSLYGKVEEGLNVATTTNVYRWVMKDVPSLNVLRIEKYISTPKNYIDRVEFQLYKVNNGETSHDVTNTWAKANEELLKSESFGQPLRQDNYYMNQDLDAAITGSTDDLMKAKKIYYYVTHNFTCINYNNARIRTTLKEVFKKHSGCVGEINLLLAAMLRQKGIPADPVLLSTREFGTNLASYP